MTKRLLLAGILSVAALSSAPQASATHACYPLFEEWQTICEDVPHRVQNLLCYRYC